MKISAIVALAAVAAVAHAQQTCWDQLRNCKMDALDKDISLGQCQETLSQSQESLGKCQKTLSQSQESLGQCKADDAKNAEAARCWKCAYTEVQRCVDASGSGYWASCYKNGMRMRGFCLEGKPCGYERPGEPLHLRFQRN